MMRSTAPWAPCSNDVCALVGLDQASSRPAGDHSNVNSSPGGVRSADHAAGVVAVELDDGPVGLR